MQPNATSLVRSARRPSRSSVSRATRPVIESLETRTLLTTWGAFPTLTGQAAAATNHPEITGAGYSIAILDSGIDYNHPALGGGFGPGHKVIAGWDFVDNDANPMDTDGHGTGLAGAAAANPYIYNGATYQGVAPGANLIALRTDNGFNWNTEAPYIAQALQWVIDHRTQYNIVAVSISNGKGHYTADTTENPNGPLFNQLAALGVALFNSSGNNGLQNGVPGIEYPGAEPSVYSVGAIDSTDTIWTNTERGPMMDLLAPGVNVPLPYYLPASNGHIYLTATGTSFTAPYAAAMVALLKQADPSLTGQQIVGILKSTGVMRSDGVGNGGPWARINVAAALTEAIGDDVYEENDTLATATPITFNGLGTASLSSLELLAGDADFYKFTTSLWSDLSFSISTTGGQFTPGWTLYNSGGTALQTLATSDDVRLAPGTYYVRINAPIARLNGDYAFAISQTATDDSANNHALATATAITLTSGAGSVSGYKMLAGLDDYFTFTLGAKSDLDLTLTYNGSTTDPSFQLLNSSGVVLASDVNGALSLQVAAGKYYIKTTSDVTLNSTYSLTVDATTAIDPPPSNPTPGDNGTGNGIAYDSAGQLHFAWFDEATGSLKYALRSSTGIWGATQTIDANPLTGQFASLALDAAGKPGVAYLDSYNADLKYAHWNSSAWDVGIVDSNKTTGYYPAIKFDAASHPIISYYYKTSGDLRVAVGNSAAGTAWTITTLDTTGDVGRYSSLALNPASGRWATAYEDTTHGHFKYAEQGKSAWAISTVDSTTKYGGGFISLAFSPLTLKPSMSYYDAYNADLKYATYNGSSWSPRALASKGSVGLYSNLRISATTGAADILYFSKSSEAAFRTTSNPPGSAWVFAQVAANAGRWISRAVDPNDNETAAMLKGTTLEILDL